MELKSINMEHNNKIMKIYLKINHHKMKSGNEKWKIRIQ